MEKSGREDFSLMPDIRFFDCYETEIGLFFIFRQNAVKKISLENNRYYGTPLRKPPICFTAQFYRT